MSDDDIAAATSFCEWVFSETPGGRKATQSCAMITAALVDIQCFVNEHPKHESGGRLAIVVGATASTGWMRGITRRTVRFSQAVQKYRCRNRGALQLVHALNAANEGAEGMRRSLRALRVECNNHTGQERKITAQLVRMCAATVATLDDWPGLSGVRVVSEREIVRLAGVRVPV